jgi:outer membrane lipoprotein-sorting protein
MHTRHFTLLLSLLLIPVFVLQASAQTADEIVEKHLTAIGGRAALAKLTTRKGTGTITISTPNGDLKGPIELYAKAPNKTRAYMTLDLSAMGLSETMVLDQKFDGTTGWALNSLQGDSEITGNQLDNMRNSVFPSPLLNYKAMGTTLEVLPGETVAGKSMIVLMATPKTGSASRLYVDPDTFLIVRSVATVNVPAMGGDVEQTAEASDYRTVDGVKVPFVTVNATAMQTATITLKTVEHNVAIDDAMFSVKSALTHLMMTLTSNFR